eukprot:3309458-Pleurochrysis_carterae.AAC.3
MQSAASRSVSMWLDSPCLVRSSWRLRPVLWTDAAPEAALAGLCERAFEPWQTARIRCLRSIPSPDCLWSCRYWPACRDT